MNFDAFMEERGYSQDEAPEAFAQWLANESGEPVSGIATDLSNAVRAEPEHGLRRTDHGE